MIDKYLLNKKKYASHNSRLQKQGYFNWKNCGFQYLLLFCIVGGILGKKKDLLLSWSLYSSYKRLTKTLYDLSLVTLYLWL